MSSSDVVTHLTAHNCPNVTSDLDLAQCHDKPSFGGGFSDIYQGQLRDGTRVAIKCLRLFSISTGHNLKVHKHAARELYAWSKFHHENVLDLFGLALFQNQIAMVSPWMEHGSLVTYVAHNPDINIHALCAQVAEGLAYVHSQGVVHGDIKGANVLISQSGTAKLTDFGCTTIQQDATVGFTQTGTHNFSLRWAAPELLTDDDAASVASDVYALGMVRYLFE
ncbi:hypothetical protein FS749_015608 [Ceratobasidium sp. UAMH 11750]|nr:hypothetical protein FS749_015608 [Ceratobasidium sp. UAMH 11750]